MSVWVPRPFQPIMYEWILKLKRCALFVPMGFGKSSAVLWALDTLLLSGGANRILILAPLRVARTVWPDEVRKWDQFSHLRISLVLGTPEERIAALYADADIYCCNYENLVWLIETLDNKWFFDTVVADECMKLKGMRLRQGTKRARALASVIHTKVCRFIGLTGTPAPNGLQDLWAIGWFIDSGQRLGRSYDAFMNRWFGFRKFADAFAHQTVVKRVAFPFAQKEIQGLLSDVCLSLKVENWFDIDEPIVNVIHVDLPALARRHYKEMERDMFTLLDGYHIEAFGAAAKTMKTLQLASGFAYVEGSNSKWQVLHDEKIEALRSVIDEASGMPVLVAYHFKADLMRLMKAFPKGRVLDKTRETVIEWNGGRIPILFAHPASAGHGLNLQSGGNILCFFGLNWNLEEHMQIIERIGPVRQRQAGYKRPVYIHYIVARRTVDELVMQRLRDKREVQDILLDALNLYKQGRPTESELA